MLTVVGWIMFGLGILADIVILAENDSGDGGLDSGPLVAVLALAISPPLIVWSVSLGLAALIKLKLQEMSAAPPAHWRPHPFEPPSSRPQPPFR